MASQKQIIALQWELQQIKHNANEERNQSRKIHRRIQELEEDNLELRNQTDSLESRHESHMEELRFLQNEFFCVKSHLEKTRREIMDFHQALMSSAANSDSGGFWGKRNSNKETEEQSLRLIDRQEFSILVLDTTITSLTEILEEYVSPAPGRVVEEVQTIEEEEEQEEKQEEDTTPSPPSSIPSPPSAIKRGESNGRAKRRVSIVDLAEPATLRESFVPPLQKQISMKKQKSKRGRLMKKMSSRKGMLKKFSSRSVVDKEQKEEDMGNFIHEIFKANQIRFAQYLESDSKGHFTDYANSRKSWAKGSGDMDASAQSAVDACAGSEGSNTNLDSSKKADGIS